MTVTIASKGASAYETLGRLHLEHLIARVRADRPDPDTFSEASPAWAPDSVVVRPADLKSETENLKKT